MRSRATVLSSLKTWRECERCRYPMTRWSALRDEPERNWVVWNPQDWILPFPFWGVVLFVLLASTAPGLVLLRSGRRSGALLMGLGYLVAAGTGFWNGFWRRRRRSVLAQQLQPEDWVCPSCLHAVPGQGTGLADP